MNKEIISAFFKGLKANADKYSPELLTGFGVTGLISGTFMAVKAAKAEKPIWLSNPEGDPTFKDKICHFGRTYWPTLTIDICSVGLIVSGSKISRKRSTALATAYSLTEAALKKYQEKVIETIGEKKSKAIEDAVAKKNVEDHPVVKNEVIFTGKGDTLCYESLSSRYFKSDIEKIRRVENIINRKVIDEMYVTVNEMYDELGLDHTKTGDMLGWNVDSGMISFAFSSQLTTDGEPCLVLDFTGCMPKPL